MTRRKSRKVLSIAIKTVRVDTVPHYSWSCPWCSDAFSSANRSKVCDWGIRHLNAHMRRQVVRKPDDAA